MRQETATASKIRTAGALVWLLLGVAAFEVGCSRTAPTDLPRPPLTVLQGETMGTTYTVKLAADEAPLGRQVGDGVLAEEAQSAIARVLAEVDDLMTTYRPSEVTAFNKARTTNPIAISQPTARTVALALEIAGLTHGAFDVTIGPLVEAWGFGTSFTGGDGGSGAGSDDSPPDPSRLAQISAHVGSSKLILDLPQATLAKTDPAVEIDLSAIAKGYGVDRVAEVLDTLGYEHYLVEVGGEVRVRGLNQVGRPWTLGIERPTPLRGRIQRVVNLSDLAMATSGDYRNYREVDGRRVSHILDPRTGRPIDHNVASATVVDRDCARADGMATAMMVLGQDEGMLLAERHGWAVLLLVREGDVFVERESTAFSRLLESSRL